MYRERTENQTSKRSLVNQALFPEGIITLNKQILEKHLTR